MVTSATRKGRRANKNGGLYHPGGGGGGGGGGVAPRLPGAEPVAVRVAEVVVGAEVCVAKAVKLA
jgi:hypothetical protein